MLQSLNDFPPELLTRIFLQLSYKSLLSVLAVSVLWNALVTEDPALSVQMFKKRSTVYAEPGAANQALYHFRLLYRVRVNRLS